MNLGKFQEVISLSESLVSKLETIEQEDLKNGLPDLKHEISGFNSSGQELLKDSETLRIGVVGQMNVGKSSFLNSLIFNGENILPKAATPMTAGLTVLQYTEKQSHFEVEYFTREEWHIFEIDHSQYCQIESDIREEFRSESEDVIQNKIKEATTDAQRAAHENIIKCRTREKIGQPKPDSVNFSSISELQTILEKYVGANGKYTSVVKSLNIFLNDERLKGIQIVDTPGVNDPIISREKRTRDFLQACHGVFFLSFSSRFFDSSDAEFIDIRIGKQGVGVILMLACKFDSVLQNLGMKYKGREDGLELAIDEAKSKLKATFEEKRANLTCCNLKFAFDTTSGIGFAIAQKKPSEWDEVENHVVKRMKAFYPNYFDNEDDIKDNFLILANFDTIKSEYLEKLFIENKDEIISNKINQFFALNTENILEYIDQISNTLKNKKKQLTSATLQELHKQKEATKDLFERITDSASDYFDKFGRNLQSGIKEIEEEELANNYKPDTSSVPTVSDSIYVRHKKMKFFHTHNTFYLDKIDRFKLHQIIIPSIVNYAKQLRVEWKKIFKKQKEEMFGAFCEIITDFSNEVETDDRAYRDIMSRFLSVIDGYRILNLDDIVTNRNVYLANYIDDNEHTDFTLSYECSKSEVQAKVDSEASTKRTNFRSGLTSRVNDTINALNNEADENIKKILKKIENLKERMEESLNKEADVILSQLETEINSKEETLAKIDSAIDILKQLKRIYK